MRVIVCTGRWLVHLECADCDSRRGPRLCGCAFCEWCCPHGPQLHALERAAVATSLAAKERRLELLLDVDD